MQKSNFVVMKKLKKYYFIGTYPANQMYIRFQQHTKALKVDEKITYEEMPCRFDPFAQHKPLLTLHYYRDLAQ